MFRSAVEAAEKAWYFYEPFTLLSYYEAFQKRVIDVYAPYRYLAERYSKIVKRKIFCVTEEYLEENPDVAAQNVALLKNAMELWRAASRTSDAVAPILYHYSWHCFNSFFAYTFFGWEPTHSTSHGVKVPSKTLSENLEDIEIRFPKIKDEMTRGLFQRLIDAWTLLGASLAFSPFLPVFEGKEITFKQNKLYLLGKSRNLPLKQLLTFNPVEDFERKYWKSYGRDNLLQNTSLSNSMNLPTRIMKNYLTIFVASSIARYRPILWTSILIGEKPNQTDFALQSRHALLHYALFDHLTSNRSLLYQLSRLLEDVKKGKFELKKLP